MFLRRIAFLQCNSSVQRIDSKEAPGIEVSNELSIFDLEAVMFSPYDALTIPHLGIFDRWRQQRDLLPVAVIVLRHSGPHDRHWK